MHTRKRIRYPEVVVDARQLVEAGADVDLILLFFRDRGLDVADCIYSIQEILGCEFPDAKSLVAHSKAWSAEYESDSQLPMT